MADPHILRTLSRTGWIRELLLELMSGHGESFADDPGDSTPILDCPCFHCEHVRHVLRKIVGKDA